MTQRQLSDQYNKLYLENIEIFRKGIVYPLNEDQYFIDFYPSIGCELEKCEFLIYGQAVKGWGSGFGKKNKPDLNKSIIYSNELFNHENNIMNSPINWVNAMWSDSIYNSLSNKERKFYQGTYRCYRSFFWNVVYKLISDWYADLDRESWNWSNKLVWSNLYKIAPDGKNPNEYERNLQFHNSAELVKQEINEIEPNYCIVLTNDSWWKPFREKLNTRVLKFEPNEQIESVEQYNGTKIIVTSRPYIGDSEKWVAKIKEHLV